jgi:uncharacterized protein (DUF736 family)
MIKNFAIFKAKEKKSEKSPDYTISIKVNDKLVTIGGCWIKEGKAGKYFSCSLSEGYKERKGYHMSVDQEVPLTDEEKAQIVALKAGEAAKQAVQADIKADEIPF